MTVQICRHYLPMSQKVPAYSAWHWHFIVHVVADCEELTSSLTYVTAGTCVSWLTLTLVVHTEVMTLTVQTGRTAASRHHCTNKRYIQLLEPAQTCVPVRANINTINTAFRVSLHTIPAAIRISLNTRYMQLSEPTQANDTCSCQNLPKHTTHATVRVSLAHDKSAVEASLNTRFLQQWEPS